MKLKCTALGSYVMTAKPSQRGNDDSEVLKFKDFQGPLTSNSKTFKALFHFQGLSRSWKNGIIFSKTFKNFQGHVVTLNVAPAQMMIGNLLTEDNALAQSSSHLFMRYVCDELSVLLFCYRWSSCMA